MQNIYLICGVSGSGKSWVCNQLVNKFHYLSHDLYNIQSKNYEPVLVQAAKTSTKPILADCPFGERLLRDSLEKQGCTIIPYFIVEPVSVITFRHLKRNGKEPSKAVITRAGTIINRAQEWNAKYGNSQYILDILTNEVVQKSTQTSI